MHQTVRVAAKIGGDAGANWLVQATGEIVAGVERRLGERDPVSRAQEAGAIRAIEINELPNIGRWRGIDDQPERLGSAQFFGKTTGGGVGSGGIGMADQKNGAVAQALGQRIDGRFGTRIALGCRQQGE